MNPNSKHRRKRTVHQRALDLRDTERMTLRGLTPEKIAEELAASRPYKIGPSQIRYDLERLAETWRKQASHGIASAKARQLRRLEIMSAEAWQAWDESKARGEAGAQFLRVLVDVHDRVAKILGLDSPARHELTGKDGGPIALTADSPLDPEAKVGLLKRHLARLEESKSKAEPVLAG